MSGVEMAPVRWDTVASLRVQSQDQMDRQTERGSQSIYLPCEMSPDPNRVRVPNLHHLSGCFYMVDLFLVQLSKGPRVQFV